MPRALEPDLSVLEPAQQSLWQELDQVPESFVLYGGTAVALQLGHRISVDFDLFTKERFDPDAIYKAIRFLRGSDVMQKTPDTLTCIVDRGAPVQVSLFSVPDLVAIRPPKLVRTNGLKVASMLDLAGMKAAVVQKRAEAKDYIDLEAIFRLSGVDLPHALAAARVIFGPSFNPLPTLKALAYFDDGNLQTLKQDVRDGLAAAVAGVDLDRLPIVKPSRDSFDEGSS